MLEDMIQEDGTINEEDFFETYLEYENEGKEDEFLNNLIF